jgi:gluconate 5-dehydrogenase
MTLQDKTAVVTGASRGIGRSIALRLARDGARVVVHYKDNAGAADEVVAAIVAEGGEATALRADIADLVEVRRFSAEIEAAYQRVDILVNNAGTTWGAPAEEHPPEAWLKVMNLNVNAMFFLSQEVARRCMIPGKKGKIINMASVAGLRAHGSGMTTIAYTTSKAAVLHMTRGLAAEWGKYGINVNAICPGFFPSKMTRGTLGSVSNLILESTPNRRLGNDEDLKGLAVLLASEASRHISGQAIAVDGGATIV